MPADAPATTSDSPSLRPNGAPADLELDLELPMAVSPAAKLVVERLEGVLLVGWAYDPAAPGREPLSLVCGDEALPAQIRRVSRADVARAVGAQGGLLLGFELELPLSTWEALARHPGALCMRFGADGLPVKSPQQPSVLQLQDWMAALRQRPEVDRIQAELASLAPHLEHAIRWADAAVTAPAATPPAPSTPCHVEGWTGLLLRGWLADTPEVRQPLRLRCGDRRFDVPVRRTSRGDVAKSLKLEHDEVGFLVEVPGTLWKEFPTAEELVLQLEGPRGPIGPPWRLPRVELPARLNEALDWPEAAQRGQLALLAMEHLAWAGLLGEVAGAPRQALAVLAESAGVGAWLSVDLPSHGPDAERFRTPFRITPRGRLGRWLLQPANADRALKFLQRLQRRPSTQGMARRLEVVLTRAVGLFDKGCYDRQISPAERQDMPALRHYVEHGDARSLMPMVLFDARHYTGQLPGRQHPGINRLLHYALVGRHQGLSPCAWFDPDFYLANNVDVRGKGFDPLTHFVNFGWKERRRPAPRFEPTTGTRSLLQRLQQGPARESNAPVDPMQRYLLDGLPADAQPVDSGRLPWAAPARLDGRDYLNIDPWRHLPRPTGEPRVDVVVPVYAGAQETLRCLWSVLSSWVDTPYQLVVIDDCSPEPALSAHLRELAAMGLIHLMVNERNRGFVATVNRGLKLHWDRDVVILNADTRVHAGWLDRLVAHGEAEPRAASVTPLSNNATVCSYPRMLHSNWEKLELDDGEIDALAARVNRGRHVEVPTGVGFCMWMRRAALDAIGLFDVERFGRGYGEENDWCMRANAAGWVQLVASDTYVLHQGSVSFAVESNARTRAAIVTLLQRHPDYQQRIDEWIAHDPLMPERARLDAARLKRAAEVNEGGGLVLMINHARGGGAARHESEEAERLRRERGLGVVTMHPSRKPGCVTLAATHGHGETLDLPALQAVPLLTDGRHGPCHPAQALLDVLAALDLREIHLHHLVDHPPVLRELLPYVSKTLGVPLSVTVHDYHLICPRINLVDASGRYCGEPDRDTCNRCLQRDELGQAAGRIGPWRAAHGQLLAQAQRVIVPDEDVAARLSNYFPTVRVQVQPHEPLHLPANLPPRGPVRRVLVIGALSPIKGLHVLRGLASSRAAAELGLHFTLLGYSSDDAALRAAGVEVLGRYEDKTLPARIEAAAPDLILLPSVWPETFCYVLTSAAESGRPVAVFDLGAQARRLKEAKAPAVYLPIELASQPELLARALVAGR
ncbi:glycosyltransferase [Ideonella sp. DXS29W]|uniref:Glycosyltransferase n=1 Tax=Ideonella lacteola TaxID=2984193 RepID=A0ABU9BRR8_9BURK